MKKKNSFCQSCSMPLKKDPKGGGTESDGTTSEWYCSLCYQNGRFTQPDFTLSDMKSFVKSKLKEMGFPGFIAGFFTLGLGRLKRWKT